MQDHRLPRHGPGNTLRAVARFLPGVLLGSVLLGALSLAGSAADPAPHVGGFSSLSAAPAQAGTASIDVPSAPSAGQLIYADYKRLEERARSRLVRSLGFRQDISPYQDKESFDELVRSFDSNGGFNAGYDDPDPAITNMTLLERIELADQELNEARDLYAYLAVFAPEDRFRADGDYSAQLCAQPENPNPTPAQPDGSVLPPIVDWCDFPARLRQSVREAANIRLIFAQQFVVDATGPSFSASALVGGEAAVEKELAKLDAAIFQYERAEQRVAEAQNRVVGNGCYVADFFGQTEWQLMSRVAEHKERAQHQRAVRLSYMNIADVDDIPRRHAEARDAYRAATVDGYLQLAAMAGRGQMAAESRCGSTPPAQEQLDELASSLKTTMSKAQEMQEGRNIFGFDISFTPARPFSTGVSACGSSGKGLHEEAFCAAQRAEAIQKQAENASRNFDLNQQALITQINQLNTGLNLRISDDSGCDHQGGDDAAFFDCTAEQIRLVATCDPTDATSFEACIANPAIENSNLRTARRDMRTAWLGLEQAQVTHQNILKRADIEKLRNVQVTSEILTGAKTTAAIEAIIIAANCCTINAFPPGASINPGAFVEAALRPGLILEQAAHEMRIEDANSEAAVRNLFLDLAEAQYQIDMAFQQYRTAESTYDDMSGDLEAAVFEAKRQRAYLVASPANDPAYRMVRDSRRLELAAELEVASQLAYLSARRAEYEYTARLSGSNFRISDIYKARTANDVLLFLERLGQTVGGLPGSVKDAEIDDEDFSISVARHVLGLSDAYLTGEGFSGAALEAERLRRFREWLASRKRLDDNQDEIIAFDFTTTSDTKGILSQVKQQGYDFYWLHKLAGTEGGAQGMGINLVTQQSGLTARQSRISQSGQVELTSFAGCLFTYRLMPDAVMLGLDWPSNQPTDTVTGIVQAAVNGTGSDPTNRFLGRPVAANWQVVMYTGPSPALDIDQLEDIELELSTTFATRESNQAPSLRDCVRADY